MNIEELREYCLSLPATSEGLPFDKTTLVFKVGNKMFALTDLEDPLFVNLKCDPEKAIELREQYASVQPGHHMHKKHWNTVLIDGSIDDTLLKKWIEDSYKLVIKGMTKKEREELARGDF